MEELGKKKIEIFLEGLDVFENPELKLEQYPTDSTIASEMIHTAILSGDIRGKILADLGAGTGRLGIGAIFGNPERIFLVEVDKRALEVAKLNLEKLRKLIDFTTEVVFLNCHVEEFKEKVDTILMNPPFGKFKKGADKTFLEKSLELGNVIHTLLNFNSEPFVRALCRERGFEIYFIKNLQMKIKYSFPHHRKKIHTQPVDYYRLVRER